MALWGQGCSHAQGGAVWEGDLILHHCQTSSMEPRGEGPPGMTPHLTDRPTQARADGDLPRVP